MVNFRDIKRAARRELHSRMFVPALYLVPTTAPSNPYDPLDPEYDTWTPPPPPYYEDPLEVKVRLHFKFGPIGDAKGTNFNYAERLEVDPKILFMRGEVASPVRGAVVSLEVGEAYRVDHIYPPDDITVTADVLKLTPSEAAGLPVPDDDV